MNKICNIPFTEMKCGDVLSPCCSAWLNTTRFNVDMLKTNTSAIDIWKNTYAEFRDSILDGSYRYCSDTCPNKIAVFNNVSQSLDLSHPDIYNKIMVDSNSVYPINVTLTYDATCNLMCKSCRTKIIKSDTSNVSKLFNSYAPMLKECTEITISGDGDAFASPHYFSLLQSDLTEFAPNLNRIILQTNGLLFNQTNYEKIHPANKKLIKLISISIDAASEEIYKTTRGGNFSTLCKNLEYIKQLKQTTSDWLYIYSGYTISKNNLSDAVKFIDFVHQYDFNMIQYWLVRDWDRGEKFENLTVDINSNQYKEVRNQIAEKIELMKPSMEIKWMISDKNVESINDMQTNTTPIKIQQIHSNKLKKISINSIINEKFSNIDINNNTSYSNTTFNNNTPSKKFAIFCPFYISEENEGKWITSWLDSIKYESAPKYYTLSYPKNFDISKYKNIINQLNKVATCIKSQEYMYHTDALKLAHDYLKKDYLYMVHIEQDVILKEQISNHLVNKIIEDDNNILITDIKSSIDFDFPCDIDVSLFVINLINYDSSNYYTYTNIKSSDDDDDVRYYNVGDTNKLHSLLDSIEINELYNAMNSIIHYVYKPSTNKHWIHEHKGAIGIKTPIFIDSVRAYPLHAYINNKLSVIYGITHKAKHLRQSRLFKTVSTHDVNTIVKWCGYPPIGEKSPNENINLDTYLSDGVDIVIISKNQKASLEQMINTLKFDIPNANRIFVLDRCTDGSKELLESYNETYIERNDAVGFCAGSARNIGLKHTNPEHDILFLDGDRIPHNLNYERIVQMLYYFNISMIKNKSDTRSWFVNVPSINTQYDKYNNNVRSSAILLRRTAINEISNIVGNGNIFDPIFDGNWGCEDEYLGDVAYSLGMISGGFPSHIYVDGTTTPSTNSSDEYRNQVEKRNKLRSNLFNMKPDLLIGNQPYLNKDERRELVDSIVSERRNVMRNMIKQRNRE